MVTLDSFITNGGDGYDPALFKGYEIQAFNLLNKETAIALIEYLKGVKKPITVESTHMPVISKE